VFTHTKAECIEEVAVDGSGTSLNEADPPHLPLLLCPSGERRGEEAASQGSEERATVHHGPPPGRVV
jgi:hypothetical protein